MLYVYARSNRFVVMSKRWTECVCFPDNVRETVPKFWC